MGMADNFSLHKKVLPESTLADGNSTSFHVAY